MKRKDLWTFMKSNLANRLALGFALALVFLGANAWVAHDSVKHLIDSQRWVTHTYQVLGEVETDVSLAKDVETGARGYIITANPEFLQPYEAAKLKVKNKLEPLYTMTRDNPPQQKRVLELSACIDRKLILSKNGIELVKAGRRAEAERQVGLGKGKAAMDAVRAQADEIIDVERNLLQDRLDTLHRDSQRANATIWSAMLFCMLLLCLVYLGLARSQFQSLQFRVQGEELSVALADLKRLEAMRDSLNSMLVHDLRTPLTTILGPLEMLQDEQFGELEATQREIVNMSLLSSRRLLGLVNELLDISKMEAGEMKVRHDSLRPQVVIEEATKHIALAQFDGGARIDRDIPETLPLLQADQEILTRVLINLLGNAIKFTPRTGKITLGARECKPLEVLPERLQPDAEERDEEHFSVPSLLFCVRDTGEGIPAQDLDRIFDKFGQVEARQEGRKMSTGLGLTFCKLAVEAHGGLIWVESEPGQGSTFYFTIPLRSIAPESETSSTTTAAEALT